MGPRGILTGGLAYVVLYALLTTLVPAPSQVRVPVAVAFLLVPTLLAIGTTWHAARGSGANERPFWILLCAAAIAQAVNEVLHAAHTVWLPEATALRVASHMGYYTYVILVFVSLLVRPDRPRALGQTGPAALEWIMAVVTGYFLILYFVLLPAEEARYPWFLVLTLQELIPGLWALALSSRVREMPFRRVYRLIALGLVAGAMAGLRQNWLYSERAYPLYDPFDAAWMLPLIGIAAAARCPRSPVWVRSARPSAGDRHRARLALLAAAFPPSLDLLARALGLQPHLADDRSQLALVSAAAVSLLLALRLRPSARAIPAVEAPADTPEVRAALGEPTERLQFASGVAHEINNPLMAVAGWAELALRRGAPAEPLLALIASTRGAAETVLRLQQLARSGSESDGGEG